VGEITFRAASCQRELISLCAATSRLKQPERGGDRRRPQFLLKFVSFRQACMNLFEGFGIVGCRDDIWWRTVDEHEQETRETHPT